MLIHHSFGFPNIFLKGGLETPKTPLDLPLQKTYLCENFLMAYENFLISSILTEIAITIKTKPLRSKNVGFYFSDFHTVPP